MTPTEATTLPLEVVAVFSAYMVREQREIKRAARARHRGR